MTKALIWGLTLALTMSAVQAADNELTEEEQKQGWILLFDGKTLDGWKTNELKPSQRPVEDGCLAPHKCGGYLLMHEKDWGDCVLKADFKMSPKCNSGIFFRVFPLDPPEGKSIAFNGIEFQIFDGSDKGLHECGALYDLVPNSLPMVKPAGEWNQAEIVIKDNVILCKLNGEQVAFMDCDQWTEPGKRPDGSEHKFPVAYKDHPRHGYIGFQDHGHEVWFKNVKVLPLDRAGKAEPSKP